MVEWSWLSFIIGGITLLPGLLILIIFISILISKIKEWRDDNKELQFSDEHFKESEEDNVDVGTENIKNISLYIKNE